MCSVCLRRESTTSAEERLEIVQNCLEEVLWKRHPKRVVGSCLIIKCLWSQSGSRKTLRRLGTSNGLVLTRAARGHDAAERENPEASASKPKRVGCSTG